ncbi:erythromycin esterase family protein, partial [Bacillus sp. JJ1127]|uniref:erythromycin esterase family protein n=1 Tax=Bacillus sp. JJ1127 TaxID=3122952 RepID=UPI002FFDE200
MLHIKYLYKYTLVTGLLILIAVAAYYLKSKDTEGTWLNRNSHKVNSLTSNNYDDLEFLKEVLKDKQYVFLGESSHGVAEYSTAKVRLIKYLHENLGFDVVAFESHMGDAAIASTELTTNKFGNTYGIMKKALYLTPWNNKQTAPLFDYILNKKETNSLSFIGFDMQTSSTFSNFMSKWIESYNQEDSHKFTQLESSWADMYSNLSNLEKKLTEEDVQKYENDYNKFIVFVDEHANDLGANYPQEKNMKQLIIKSLQNRIDFIKRAYRSNYTEDDKFSIRDVIMEENIIWLSNAIYPNKKIIFWAHNGHIRDNNTEIFAKDYGQSDFQQWQSKSMFENLPNEYKKKSYILGFY